MAMDKSAADAFVYAKASGMLARSFVGERATKLFSAHSLSELWTLVFKTEVPAVPETLLAKAIEVQAEERFLSDYLSLIKNYSYPSAILISLLHFYDYDNLKEIGAALCFKEKEMPHVAKTAPFSLVDYTKWPDIKAITRDSTVSWYNTVPLLSEQQQNDYRLDCQYIEEVWQAAKKSSPSCREEIKHLLGEKFRIENVLWALRLKVYYNMDTEQILTHLAYSHGRRHKSDPLVSEAVKVLAWETDNWEKWRTWRYASLLNPHEEGVVWNVDPRWLSNAYTRVYVQKAYRMFHLYPFTDFPMVCWFIVKQHELDNIRTASESIRMSVSSAEAMQSAGIQEVYNG